MNLDGMKQIDIEREFDMKQVKIEISEQIEEFAQEIEDKEPLIESVMNKYLTKVNILDVKEVVIVLLTMIGNAKAGIQLGEDNFGKIKPLAKGMIKIEARDIPFNVFIKTFYKDRYIQETFKHMALDFTMDIAVELDGIFFDIIKRVEPAEDGQFRTLTYIRSEILFLENSSLRAHYERFRLPLIEQPHQWLENQAGGYHLSKSRVITNRGCGKQPQRVLDILNKLQDQPYQHKQDLDKELEFNIKKFKEDNWKKGIGYSEGIAIDKANAMALTCNETYEAIGNKVIYFQWQFGANGRMYPTGYDIHLHGNKAKKGALRPVLW